MKLRLFSTFKSSILPLNTVKNNKLKIYSSIKNGPSDFRLTNGTKVSGRIAIIGGNYYILNEKVSPIDSLKCLLRILRPIPEIVVIGQRIKDPKDNLFIELKEEFGCSVEVSERLIAANTFNTLIDDDRSVIGIFL